MMMVLTFIFAISNSSHLPKDIADEAFIQMYTELIKSINFSDVDMTFDWIESFDDCDV